MADAWRAATRRRSHDRVGPDEAPTQSVEPFQRPTGVRVPETQCIQAATYDSVEPAVNLVSQNLERCCGACDSNA